MVAAGAAVVVAVSDELLVQPPALSRPTSIHAEPHLDTKSRSEAWKRVLSVYGKFDKTG